MCRYSPPAGAPSRRCRRRATWSTAANKHAEGDKLRAPYAMQRYVFVTDDRQEALKAAEAARYIRRVAMSMRNNVARLDGAFLQEMPAPDEPPLEDIASRMIVGDAETCAEKLTMELTELQPVHVSCFMGLPGMPQDRYAAVDGDVRQGRDAAH